MISCGKVATVPWWQSICTLMTHSFETRFINDTMLTLFRDLSVFHIQTQNQEFNEEFFQELSMSLSSSSCSAVQNSNHSERTLSSFNWPINRNRTTKWRTKQARKLANTRTHPKHLQLFKGCFSETSWIEHSYLQSNMQMKRLISLNCILVCILFLIMIYLFSYIIFINVRHQ